MAIIVPNTASLFASAACVVGSENKWVWLGFARSGTASGCVMWYRSGSEVAGSAMLPITSGSSGDTQMYGPFNSTDGVYAGCIVGGSAVVWMKR